MTNIIGASAEVRILPVSRIQAIFTDADGDNVKFTDENGIDHITALSSAGKIPDKLKTWIAAGNIITQYVASPGIVAKLPKLLVIDRLEAAGKFSVALTALQSDVLTYERWSASTSVDPLNPEVIGLLDAIGADKAVILAPE